MLSGFRALGLVFSVSVLPLSGDSWKIRCYKQPPAPIPPTHAITKGSFPHIPKGKLVKLLPPTPGQNSSETRVEWQTTVHYVKSGAEGDLIAFSNNEFKNFVAKQAEGKPGAFMKSASGYEEIPNGTSVEILSDQAEDDGSIHVRFRNQEGLVKAWNLELQRVGAPPNHAGYGSTASFLSSSMEDISIGGDSSVLEMTPSFSAADENADFEAVYTYVAGIDARGAANNMGIIKARHKISGEHVTVKILRNEDLEAEIDQINTVLTMNHPNIVREFGVMVWEAEGNLHVEIMEHLAGGDLEAMFSSGIHPPRKGVYPIPMDELKQPMLALIHLGYGMNYLHTQDQLHGDLKPQNTMFDRPVMPGGIDSLDMSSITKLIDVSGKGSLGSPGFLAPERTITPYNPEYFDKGNLSQNSKSTDIYSFGILANVILTGTLPTCLKKISFSGDVPVPLPAATQEEYNEKLDSPTFPLLANAADDYKQIMTDEFGIYNKVIKPCLAYETETRPEHFTKIIPNLIQQLQQLPNDPNGKLLLLPQPIDQPTLLGSLKAFAELSDIERYKLQAASKFVQTSSVDTKKVFDTFLHIDGVSENGSASSEKVKNFPGFFNGVLDWKELTAHSLVVGDNTNDSSVINKWFKLADVNGDEKIQWDEWIAATSSLLKAQEVQPSHRLAFEKVFRSLILNFTNSPDNEDLLATLTEGWDEKSSNGIQVSLQGSAFDDAIREYLTSNEDQQIERVSTLAATLRLCAGGGAVTHLTLEQYLGCNMDAPKTVADASDAAGESSVGGSLGARLISHVYNVGLVGQAANRHQDQAIIKKLAAGTTEANGPDEAAAATASVAVSAVEGGGSGSIGGATPES